MNEAKALGLLREKIRLKHMEYSTEKSYSSWLKKYMGFVRTLPAHVEPISYQEYDGDIQRERFGRQELGIGATMFFNAAYWILGELEPDEISFVGCSMDYPKGSANTFYGSGNADPLRFSNDMLHIWFLLFERHALRRKCELVNLGSKTGLMPY
ncbi:hypothetical protein PDESU_03319 [Pontiella desulfatans]|uniref:Uncharacterized protein n=1 Tax=Pontiella desulfatans TaxID=2750659 RepID=A0A6C2U457_PONDE|nr:hypothetical protein [Pontiella desulfatans]VGO14750.1 hypothetical protein PDESU_03319 [Pontiella desulfatans]